MSPKATSCVFLNKRPRPGDELRLIRALLRENPNVTFLFLSERKAPLSVDGVQKLVERLGEAAGFAFPIHAHMLRHSAGYALAGRGVDTRTHCNKRPGWFRLKRLPGGACTHWKAPPFRGAREQQTLALPHADNQFTDRRSVWVDAIP